MSQDNTEVVLTERELLRKSRTFRIHTIASDFDKAIKELMAESGKSADEVLEEARLELLG